MADGNGPGTRLLRSVAVVMAVALGLGFLLGRGCRAPDSPTRGAHESAQATSGPAGPRLLEPTGVVEVRQAAPELVLADLAGNRVRLSDHRGRVVVLNAWATWCPPCVQEMPSLIELSRRAPPGVVVASVCVDEAVDVARAASSRMGLTFPVLHDPGGHALAAWGTVKYPETWIIGPDGVVAARIIGAQDWASEASLAELRRLTITEGAGGPG